MNIFEKLLAWLSGLGQQLLLIIEGAGNFVLQNGGQVLIDAAVAGVAAAEATGGTGLQKFQTAKAQVIAVLEKEGTPLIMGAIDTAIQLAYAALPKHDATTETTIASAPAVSTVPTAGPAAETAGPNS